MLDGRLTRARGGKAPALLAGVFFATLLTGCGPTALGTNGCAVDAGGTVWTGGEALHAFDAQSLDYNDTFEVGSAIKGVSIDIDGKVWGVGGIGAQDRAVRLDPATGQVQVFMGLTGAYSYSDMTGIGLRSAGYALF